MPINTDLCPACEDEVVGDPIAGCSDVFRCSVCGEIWDRDDETEGGWDPSSHHRTRMRRDED